MPPITDGERVGRDHTTVPPAPHLHNPPSGGDVAKLGVLAAPLSPDETAFVQGVKAKATAVGDTRVAARCDALLA